MRHIVIYQMWLTLKFLSVLYHPHISTWDSQEPNRQSSPKILMVPTALGHLLCAFCATVHCCLQCKAPPYLADLCALVSDIASRQHLRSASSNQLVVPRHCRTQFGRQAFSVAGPMAWNALPDSIRDTALSTCSFRRYLKTLLFFFY